VIEPILALLDEPEDDLPAEGLPALLLAALREGIRAHD
jgi:hypothetical protein